VEKVTSVNVEKVTSVLTTYPRIESCNEQLYYSRRARGRSRPGCWCVVGVKPLSRRHPVMVFIWGWRSFPQRARLDA